MLHVTPSRRPPLVERRRDSASVRPIHFAALAAITTAAFAVAWAATWLVCELRRLIS
ncbi:MAG TPA: hypothetical protein VF258_00560 [Luteolibacter sp.]